MDIVEATAPEHLDAVWFIFHSVVRSGDTYDYPATSSIEDCRRHWFDQVHKTYIASDEAGKVLGTYYLKPNRVG